MHELGLMQNIVATVQEYAHANNIHKVAKVILTVGEISGVVPEALEFCFAVCVKDTVLEGAQLEIERVPARGKCRSCAEEFELLGTQFSCPQCGGSDWEMISGRELVIKGLEVV